MINPNLQNNFSVIRKIKEKFYFFLGLRGEHISFENKVFCIIVFSLSCTATAGLISNLLIGIKGALNVLILSALIISSIAFYFIRYQNKARYLKSPYLLSILGCLSAGWFLNSGLNGPILYLFFFMMVLAMVLINIRYHTIYILIIVVLIITLVNLEGAFPQWITAYENETMRRGDLLFSSLICLVTVGVLVSVLKKSYERDRKELETSQHSLIDARKQAETATHAKSKFLTNISHEIRTPLNGIIGATDLLRQTHLSEEQQKLTEVLQSGSNLLLNIMNDVLDLSKIEAGKLEIQPVHCSIRQMLRDVIGINSSTLKKSIVLDYVIEQDVHDQVMADENRVKQILLNLVGNAVKFTESGTVHVRVVAKPAYDDIQYVLFSVTDTGIGITRENLTKLFKPFSQIDNIATRKYGGTGLGLSICKKLVEMMGGNITVESKTGEGSVFTFMLPLKKSEIRQPHMSHESITPDNPEQFNPLNILLAEDNSMNRFVIEKMFKTFGYTIEMVENGKLAVECALGKKFDLIFMDIQMPVMDGLQATKEIVSYYHSTGQTPPVIIALTADAMKEDEQRCIQAGMQDYVSKPLAMDRLKFIVQKWSGRV